MTRDDDAARHESRSFSPRPMLMSRSHYPTALLFDIQNTARLSPCEGLGAEASPRHEAGEGEIAHTDGQLTADLVVAADGIHSTIRQQLFPGTSPRFLHYTGWLGLAETESDMAGSMTTGRGRYFLIHPVGPHLVYWALGAAADAPGIRHDDERDQVRRHVGDWHQPIPQLVEATLETEIRRVDIREVPPFRPL